MSEIQAFAREFLRDPLHVAALFPSFAPLCRQAAAPLPETGDPVVLDLGAGTGQVTDVIQERLGGRGELYERFYLSDSYRMTALAYKIADKSFPESLVEQFLEEPS